MSYINYFPCTKSIDIGDGVSYRLHKHWAMNVWAGEGLYSYKGDGSGCLSKTDRSGNQIDLNDKYAYISGMCSRPLVVLQRIYKKGDKEISAVLSYPNGLSHQDTYFWETYPMKDGDIDRFSSEEEMEEAIKKVLV